MKANKTNRSSNMNSLQKSNKSVASSINSQNQHHKKFAANTQKHNFQSRRSNSIDSLGSNRSNNASMNSNTRFIQEDARNYPTPTQRIDQRQIYQQPHHYVSDHVHNQTQFTQIPRNYAGQASQNYRNQNSNNSVPYHAQKRNVYSLEDSRNSYNHSYQNLSQPMRPLNKKNEENFYQERANHYHDFDSIHDSNYTIYENNQQYQKFYENPYQTNRFPPRKSQQINHMKQPLNKFQHSNNKQRKRSNNSQQISNHQYNQLKPFMSQVTNFDYQMPEIIQAEPGLSTQKNTPGKISEFFSKKKNPNSNFKQTPIRKFSDSNIFEIIEDDFLKIQSSQKKQKSRNLQEKTGIKYDNFNFSQKVELKNFYVQTQNEQKTKKIQVSQKERRKLRRTIYQINESYLEIDKLYKKTQILLTNIERSSNQFDKRVKSSNLLLKYLNKNDEREISKMKLNETFQKIDETLKKRNQKQKNNRIQNEKTFKKESKMILFQK